MKPEIILLSISAVIFLLIGYRLKSWQVIGYSFICLLLVVLPLWIKANPEIRVSSQYLSLEKRVQTNETTLELVKINQQKLEATQKQLQQTATALLKTILVVDYGIGKWDTEQIRQQQHKLIQKYTTEIESLLPKEYSRDLKKDLDTLKISP